MHTRGFVIAIDLGTGAATASWCQIVIYRDSEGTIRRERAGNTHDVANWPASGVGSTTGSPCLPTDLIYSRALKKLLLWGFEAQQYLDAVFPDIPREDVFVVQNIKLLLPDPSTITAPSTASERYTLKRNILRDTLSKEPEEIFEDFMVKLLSHVIDSLVESNYSGINDHLFELVLAFPSGWEDSIHTKVAGISTRAMEMALASHNAENIVFGLEHVYTVSETICGVKEWLRETVFELSATKDLVPQQTNLDELQVGDCFLPIDIGAGTGCLTPLRLISKRPLAVEQLDKTQSLEVCGEVVEAEFERWLRPQITKTYYPSDIPRLVTRICRMFKEEKKKCGLPPMLGSSTWTFEVNRLRAHPKREWEKNCMRLKRQDLDKLFDPMISVLEQAIHETLTKFPAIKAIIFLGQFGGNSAYLKKKIANSDIHKKVKIRHSQFGKMDVIKGAISERLTLDECFVRQYKTSKSYGTLVSLVYDKHTKKLFPNPQKHGAVPFEESEDGMRLKVIEWAIPKGTMIHDRQSNNVGKDGLRHHTWPLYEKEIGFEDTIIISDESISDEQLRKRPYSLWTTAHEQDKLYIAGKRIHVQQIPFGWDLKMSQKVGSSGNVVGSYCEDDLDVLACPPVKSKSRGPKDSPQEKLRVLQYNLIWDITEMQVKIHVQALLPNSDGPLMTQLAKERLLEQDEKEVTTESRSMALDKDIQLTHVSSGLDADPQESSTNEDADNGRNRVANDVLGDSFFHGAADADPQESSTNEDADKEQDRVANDILGDSLSHGTADERIVDLTLHEGESPGLSSSVQERPAAHNDMRPTQQDVLPVLASPLTVAATDQYQSDEHVGGFELASGVQQQDRHPDADNENQIPRNFLFVDDIPVTTDQGVDRRCRRGCFTCKDRKKMCDSIYVYDDVHKMDKCTTCMKHNIFCHPERPLQWIEDPMQKQAEQLQRKELVKLGKRKSRESFDSLDQSIKARSPTLESKGGFSSHPTVFPSIELPWQNHNTSDAIATSVQRGSYTAIRGGRRLSKQGNKPRN